ncbi:MAG TPA: lipopolysaccharide assembly protein LapA domain-containing protein [Mucilaginibacter sp.]|nr:lipopolysaccharide assembly protein LapA domain-containing protein [Mucilaginibacter sp.]
MRIKTMVIIFITILLTVVIMQNTKEVPFNFLFATFYVSKLVMLLAVAAVGFVIGVLVGRPGRPRYIKGQDEEITDQKKPTNTLSDEDKDYIN